MVKYWEKLGSTKLTVAGDTITVAGFGARKSLMIIGILYSNAQGVRNISYKIQFNTDTGSNYSCATCANGGDGTDEDFINQDGIYSKLNDNYDHYCQNYIVNVSDQEKLLIGECNTLNSAGEGTLNNRSEYIGKWANTSAQITTVTFEEPDVDGTTLFDVGSEVIVYGAAESDSIEYPNLTNGTIFEESDTGKIYMFDGTSTWNEVT